MDLKDLLGQVKSAHQFAGLNTVSLMVFCTWNSYQYHCSYLPFKMWGPDLKGFVYHLSNLPFPEGSEGVGKRTCTSHIWLNTKHLKVIFFCYLKKAGKGKSRDTEVGIVLTCHYYIDLVIYYSYFRQLP